MALLRARCAKLGTSHQLEQHRVRCALLASSVPLGNRFARSVLKEHSAMLLELPVAQNAARALFRQMLVNPAVVTTVYHSVVLMKGSLKALPLSTHHALNATAQSTKTKIQQREHHVFHFRIRPAGVHSLLYCLLSFTVRNLNVTLFCCNVA